MVGLSEDYWSGDDAFCFQGQPRQFIRQPFTRRGAKVKLFAGSKKKMEDFCDTAKFDIFIFLACVQPNE